MPSLKVRSGAYLPPIAAPDDRSRRHGFLVVGRTTRWRVSFAQDTPSPWSDKADAEKLLGKWRNVAGDALARAEEKIDRDRKDFIAKTEIEIVTVDNPNPFQVDYRKPTIAFPDGATMQFPETATQEAIQGAIEEAANEAHPDPLPQDFPGAPELESAKAWEREFLAGAERLSYPDIFSWDHCFPMPEVAQTLDELARDGWSVLSASEDRGLYRSDLAESVSAPLSVRYLLVREAGAP